MPIRPDSTIPPFLIRPPLTVGDKGLPTLSIWKDTERIFLLIEDERHLVAYDLYQNVWERIHHWRMERGVLGDGQRRKPAPQPPSSTAKTLHTTSASTTTATATTTTTSNNKDVAKGKQHRHLLRHGKKGIKNENQELQEEMEKSMALLESKQDAIEKLKNRHRIFKRAQRNLNTDEDWLFASKHFGVTTYYRRENDDSLSIKLEGDIAGVPLFEQIAVIREVDHHHKWVPFCSASMTIAELDKLDLVGWFITGVPQLGLARDGCFRAIGCDNIMEDGSVLIAGQGVNDLKPDDPSPEDTYLCDDPILQRLPIPPVPTKRGLGRMTIRKFETVVHITGPTEAKIRLVANIDPNIPFLSQYIIDFVMKHLAGVLLGKLQAAAKKIVKNPVTNHHAQRMREEAEFYQTWLMAKFKSICDEKGWEMPTVTAFALNEEQIFDSTMPTTKRHRIHTFAGIAEESSEVASFRSTPNFDRVEADAMSEITTKSNVTLWHNNPLSKYLRGTQEKEKQRKERDVAKVRQRVANMMKPKQLSFEQKERLKELRFVKGQRSDDTSHSMSAEVSSSKLAKSLLSLFKKIFSMRYKHGVVTQLSIEIVLVACLFALLHPNFFLGDFFQLEVNSSFGWIQLLWDLLFVFYMSACSCFHFLLWDFSLVYAFSAFDIGSKTGHEVKSYYGQHVRLAAAVTSFGILVLSVSIALAKVGILLSLYYLSESYRYISSLSELTGSGFTDLVRHGMSLLASCMLEKIGMIMWTCAAWVWWIVSFGGNLTDIALESAAPVSYSSWRPHAFAIASTFLSYTAVYVVVTLLLIHLLASTSRPSRDGIEESAHSTNQSVTSSHNAVGLKTDDTALGNLKSSPTTVALESSTSSGSRLKALHYRRDKAISDVSSSSSKSGKRGRLTKVKSY